jgi:transcriptional regulator of acetoin/glycerol metabolism
MAHLPLQLRRNERDGHVSPPTLPDSKDDLERSQLRSALATTQGRISEAAELLGVGRNTVTRKMQKYGLKRRDFLHPTQ